MSPPFHFRSSALPMLVAGGLLLGIAACQSGRGPMLAPPVPEPGSEAQPPIPDMTARAMFFSDKIEAEVLLGRGGFPGRTAGGTEARPGGEGRGRGGFSGGFGGGGRRGGGGGRGGGEGSEPRGRAGTDDAGTPVIHIVASNQPPARLQLRLTNHGPNPVEVEVPDFNSALGNFVVQPEKVLLLPDQPAEANPMISRLGVGSSEIPLTVALRVDGRVERQVLVLRPDVPAQPAPAKPADETAPATRP